MVAAGQGGGCRMGCGRAWTAFGPGRETFSTFRLHFSHPSLDARLEPENGIGPVLTTPSHIRELSRLFRRRHAVRLYGSHLRPVRSARECCRGILPVSASPLPCRRVLSRSQRLAACRARYLWGTSTGGGLWYSGPWPVFPAFPGVREVIMFTYVNLVKKNVHYRKQIGYKKSRPTL